MWIPEGTDWLLILCAVTAIVSLPLALRMVPRNPVYGFKTRFTLSSDEVWYPANAFVGRLMFAGSIVSAAILVFGPDRYAPWAPTAVVVVPIVLATLAGLVYLRHLRETIERR